MNKLENLIKKLCSNGAEFKSINDLLKSGELKIITPSFKIKRNDYCKDGKIPIISQEAEYISGYSNEIDKKISAGEYICFGDHSEHIKYIDFKFVQGADGLKIIKTNSNKLSMKYLYYAVSSKYSRHNNYERHFKYFAETRVPVPPLEVQCEIVHILDDFTLLSAELSAELKSRQKQYDYYRNSLLSINGKEYKLGDVGNFKTGTKPTCILESGEYEYINAGTTNSGYIDKINIDGDKVTTPSRGQGGIGFVGYQKKDFWLGPLCYAIWSKDEKILINKYLYYELASKKDEILKRKNTGGVPALNGCDLKTIPINIPSVEEQKRIVNILDKFEKLCEDITGGLPAEIEARQKQYEYYRDKLLTFKELVNEG
ncbi:MAG: restriction endonuclease subunit S [Clostridia bacterium]|jgi:type I restriction enzyme S subunit|nr:restriction endonuclease subunit S [Clostridia bacterium]